MKISLFLFLLVGADACMAQTRLDSATPTEQVQIADSIPEGSKDAYFGVGVASVPKYEGASRSTALPVIEAYTEYSNGAFLISSPWNLYETIQVGKHLSSTPGVDFGPLLALGQSLTAFTPSSGGNLIPAAGGFFKYSLADGWQLTTDLLYEFGQFKGGGVADLELRDVISVGSHQSVALWGGLRWGNRDFSQAQFGVTPDQALSHGFSVYSPSAGIQDVHVGANWRWDLSSTWILNSGAYVTHLTGNVAASPQIERVNNVSISIGLVRRF